MNEVLGIVAGVLLALLVMGLIVAIRWIMWGDRR